MRKFLVFLLIFLSMEWEVDGILLYNHQNIENNNFMEKDERQRKRYLDEDHYEERRARWNIDLADMLNFDRLDAELIIDDKPITREELKHLLNGDKIEDKDPAEGNEETREYEEDINSVIDQDEDEEFKIQIQEYVLRYLNLFLNLLNLQGVKKGSSMKLF